MAPKIDNTSDAYLIQRYDELYNRSSEFRSLLHNVVTSMRALKLNLNPGAGAAHYDPTDNSITVWRQNSGGGGGNKTDEQVRDDLFFELHNAKKSMAFDTIRGATGYNLASLTGDVKKAAGYALSIEWQEWINVVESTILVNIVNSTPGAQLLPSPPPYQANFNPGAASWLKFSNYLQAQVKIGHTTSYDKAAPGQQWKGYDILRVVASAGGNSSYLEITSNEIASQKINSRGNPFIWDLVKPLQLN
ncbi:hypothetical protein [Streptomyces sp. NPDC048277]|uniref:hypothetical protein n=1 Tax=Streptomyces sp. NPDC048277 TaxID=3155027 RepID=UPI0033F21921